MPLPPQFDGVLRLPAIAAPMFLVSGPDLVIHACQAGVIGTFPALNQRDTDGYELWLDAIEAALEEHNAINPPEMAAAPFGVNLIVHPTNPRLAADLEITVRHKVPLVITSLGAISDVVDAVHSYGGLVFHDVISMRHAEKAVAAGVDGLVAVTAGAGGHAGTLNPFAFLGELRTLFDGTLILSGAINTGRQIAAARVMGADLAYLGTRFINTAESLASGPYKDMIAASHAKDIVYTDQVSGVFANFLVQSLRQAGYDPDNQADRPEIDFDDSHYDRKPWKDIWAAGQGVGLIDDAPPIAELVARLSHDYNEALTEAAALPHATAR